MAVLDGLRVLEIGGYVTAPAAGLVLASFGADVLKVEPPDGDPYRARPELFDVWNRGKRCVRADLREPAGAARIAELAAQADVVVCAGRPSTVDRLRLDVLRAERPDLVTCEITGYGRGHAHGEDHAWEPIIQARTGLATGFGGADPVWLPFPVCAITAGMLASAGILAALLRRSATGRGDHVATSLVDAAVHVQTFLLLHGEQLGGYPPSDTPLIRAYETADGWFQIVATNSRLFGRFAEVIGHDDLRDLLSDPGGYAKIFDPAFATALGDDIARIMRTKTADEWERIFWSHGLAGARCRSVAEWLDDEQASAERVVDGSGRPEVPAVAGRPVELAIPGAAHETAWTADGWAPGAVRERDASADTAGPLEGVRILDLSTMIAGPLASRLLAEMGASVLKVEQPGGEDAYKAMAAVPHIYLDCNRSKTAEVIDLKSGDGRARFEALAREADCVIENATPGVWERLGVGEDRLRELNPRLVYVRSKGYGTAGPMSGLPTYEPTVQAVTGMQVAQGGDGPPRFITTAVNDTCTPVQTAIAVLAALLGRSRGGPVQPVGSSMVRTATFYLSETVALPDETPAGSSARGPEACRAIYEVADGWVTVCAATQSHRDAFAALFGAGASREDVAASLAAFDPAAAAERVRSAGIPAAVVASPQELREWDGVSFVTVHDDRYGDVRFAAPPVRLSGVRITSPAPRLEMLTETTA